MSTLEFIGEMSQCLALFAAWFAIHDLDRKVSGR